MTREEYTLYHEALKYLSRASFYRSREEAANRVKDWNNPLCKLWRALPACRLNFLLYNLREIGELYSLPHGWRVLDRESAEEKWEKLRKEAVQVLKNKLKGAEAW